MDAEGHQGRTRLCRRDSWANGRASFGVRRPAPRSAATEAVGLYVGQTSRDPDWRFDQHKAGYKASSAVRRFGVHLLAEMVEHLNPLHAWESLELEAALADVFREVGIGWIEGGH